MFPNQHMESLYFKGICRKSQAFFEQRGRHALRQRRTGKCSGRLEATPRPLLTPRSRTWRPEQAGTQRWAPVNTHSPSRVPWRRRCVPTSNRRMATAAVGMCVSWTKACTGSCGHPVGPPGSWFRGGGLGWPMGSSLSSQHGPGLLLSVLPARPRLVPC